MTTEAPSPPDRGILYSATGKSYRELANRSAGSVRRFAPGYPICLFTDDPQDESLDNFDAVKRISNPRYGFIDKIQPLLDAPYGHVLFLDADTKLVGALDDLFSLLQKFEFAYCHDTARLCGGNPNDYSSVFPEPNTGVLLFRNSKRVKSVIRRWDEIYRLQLLNGDRIAHDQPALQQALYESDLRITILPPEYNLRTTYPVFIGKRTKAVILHGTEATMRRVQRVNDRKRGYVTGNWNYEMRFEKIIRRVHKGVKVAFKSAKSSLITAVPKQLKSVLSLKRR